MSGSKFLDPKNDFAFKRIFGTEKNQDILIHFINDVLGFEGREKITEVTFLKTAQDPNIAFTKQSLVDVLCADETGRQYIIEMQVAKTSGFEKRAQFYAAKAYGQQLECGDSYEQLKEVIFIAITDFVMFPDKPDYYSTHCVLDKKTYSHDLKDFSFTFLELPKFQKTMDELETLTEKWCYFFKHADETSAEDLSKIVGSDVVISRAYRELDRFYWTKVELNTYEQEEKRERDAQAIIKQKLIDARAEGKVEGEAIGEARGKAEGEAVGEARGKLEGIEVTLKAIELLRQGQSIDAIAQAMNISCEVIENLQKQISH